MFIVSWARSHGLINAGVNMYIDVCVCFIAIFLYDAPMEGNFVILLCSCIQFNSIQCLFRIFQGLINAQLQHRTLTFKVSLSFPAIIPKRLPLSALTCSGLLAVWNLWLQAVEFGRVLIVTDISSGRGIDIQAHASKRAVTPTSASSVREAVEGGSSKGAAVQRGDAAVKGRKSAALVSGGRGSLHAINKCGTAFFNMWVLDINAFSSAKYSTVKKLKAQWLIIKGVFF